MGVLLAWTCGLSSCASFFLKEKSYETEGTSEVNGAIVGSAVKPMGGEQGFSFSAMIVGVGAGVSDGPFLWRIEAEGEEGVHETLTVHRLQVTTEKTGRSEPFPGEWLGKAVAFEPYVQKEKAGKTFAKVQLPGKLEVYPEIDGAIVMEARGRVERQRVKFAMNPTEDRRTETLFVPTELVKSFGKKDPTEWTWPQWQNGVDGF